MVSAYTTNKNLEKPGNGDYVDTWNIPVNSDMDVIDAALGGETSLNATGGSANLTASQYQKMILNITGAMTANVVYTIPSGVGGSWIVRNATTDSTGGPWTVTIASGGAGTNVTALRSRNIMVWSDGTNIRDVNENVQNIGTVTSVGVSGGTTGLTTSNSPVTTSGTIVIGGILNVANGGTGSNTSTGTGSVVLSNGATANMSNLTTTNLTVSTKIVIPSGNTAVRPSGSNGALYYNTQTGRYEGYAGSSWDSLGAATGGGSDSVFYLNDNVVTTSYTIPTGQNAMSTGPLTINAGVTITVPAGSAWKVI